jgi:hypothetical protein
MKPKTESHEGGKKSAAGNETKDLGVSEVGLPPSNLDEPSRSKLLGYYGIGEVFEREIKAVWGGLIPQSLIDAYLYNTEAPGTKPVQSQRSGKPQHLV